MVKPVYDTLLKGNSLVGIDGEGKFYSYFFGDWRRAGPRLKGVDPREIEIQDLINNGWRRVKLPTQRAMEKWVSDGVAKTPCGCKVELDGECKHGSESWIRILGMV